MLLTLLLLCGVAVAVSAHGASFCCARIAVSSLSSLSTCCACLSIICNMVATSWVQGGHLWSRRSSAVVLALGCAVLLAAASRAGLGGWGGWEVGQRVGDG